jgi:hypothetical protein
MIRFLPLFFSHHVSIVTRVSEDVFFLPCFFFFLSRFFLPCFFALFFSPCLDSNVHDRVRDIAALARSFIGIPTACCIIDLCVRWGGGSRGAGGSVVGVPGWVVACAWLAGM